MPFQIRPMDASDRNSVRQAVEAFWGSVVIIAHLESFNCDTLPGFVAQRDAALVGFLHYQIDGEACEVLTLAALTPRQGVGSALMAAIEAHARTQGCTRLHLVTTNDNREALAFYQNRGFHIKTVFPGRINAARKIKPSIPKIAENGIPIEDEILLEKTL